MIIKARIILIVFLSISLLVLPFVLGAEGSRANLSSLQYKQLLESCGGSPWDDLEIRFEIDVIRLEVKCSNGKRGVVRTPISSI